MKRDKLTSFIQQSTRFGGSLNCISLNYNISDTPRIGAENFGYLAYVSEENQKKIMQSGYGEMQMHIDHIKQRIGSIKKLKKRRPGIQLGLEL